ncbi:hypothetical protein JYP51_16220 [Ponticoccus gilvus]|nr:hypothetical protein [Enemella evansiae]
MAFRRYTPLPLEDRPHALDPSIPYLTRSAPQRGDIARRADAPDSCRD